MAHDIVYDSPNMLSHMVSWDDLWIVRKLIKSQLIFKTIPENPMGFDLGPTTETTRHMEMTSWWFQTLFLFSIVYGIIIPTDFHIFQRGWESPTRWWCKYPQMHPGQTSV